MIAKSSQKAIVCLTICIVSSVYARVGQEYLNWVQGKFEIPTEIQQVQTSAELQFYLESRNEFVRMATVRRLSQIDSPSTAAQLVDIARKEHSPKGPDYVPLVKLEVIRILDRIQGIEAEVALIDLFGDYWARRANIQRDNIYRLYDFYPVASSLLDSIERKSSNRSVFSVLEEAALSPDVAEKNMFSEGFRQKIWEVYLRAQVVRSGLVAEADQVEDLLNQLTLVERNWPFDYLSLEHIKAMAVRSAVSRYDDSVLRVVDMRLDQAIQARTYENASDPAKRRQELTDNRSYLQKVLRDHQHTNATLNSGGINTELKGD